MRKSALVVVVICALGLTNLRGQEPEFIETTEIEEESTEVPFAIIDEVPIFPGCEEMSASETRNCFQNKMQRHVSKNFSYPEEAEKEGQEGRILVRFIIDEEGNIAEIETKGDAPLLEEEARRIFALLPKMKPGKQRGNAVRVPYAIPLTFSLN